jgi:hypothetical protein
MYFEVKKADNCFADAENYEYRIAFDGEELLALLSTSDAAIETKVNTRLRRPTFYALLREGQRVKGLMDKNVIKVGYVPERAAEQKACFESWLGGL